MTDGLNEFCVRAWPEVARLMTAVFHDQRLGEEIAQEALMRACERWDVVGALASPTGWVVRVGLNLGRSRWRRTLIERRALVRIRQADFDHSRSEIDRELLELLRRLPQRQREAVVLRHIGDRSIEETAEILGCRTGTVKALTNQGLAGLRSGLERIGRTTSDY